jgi:hypothetical protein
VYIEGILGQHGLLPMVQEVHTNPAAWDREGALRVAPLHTLPHGCRRRCPANLCKGKVGAAAAAALACGRDRRSRALGQGAACVPSGPRFQGIAPAGYGARWAWLRVSHSLVPREYRFVAHELPAGAAGTA